MYSKFYKSFTKMFLNKIKKNNIKIVYLVKPFWDTNLVFEKSINVLKITDIVFNICVLMPIWFD